MKIKKILSLIIVAVMALSAFTACGERSDIPDGYQLIACEGDSFRLYVPTNWTSNAWSGVTGAYYSLSENASVNVYVADDAAEMTPEEYWAYCNEKLAESLDEYSFSGKTEKAVLGGQPALKTTYSAKITTVDEGVETEAVYKFLCVMARYNGKMHMLVYSAPEDVYDTHYETVDGDSEGKGIIPYFTFAEPYSKEEKKEFSSDVEAPEGMKLISTDERAYRFFVPESWVVDERTEISSAYAPEGDGSNVSLQMHMTNDESKSVADFFAECEERYAQIFTSYERLSEEDVKMDGISAKKYVYSITVGGVEYKQMQAIVMKGAVYYVLTYTALPDLFDSHMGEVEKMIEAFDIR